MRITALALLSFAATAAADWPQFRGMASEGSAAPPADVSGDDAVAWTADLEGRGLSAPIVVGGRVFVTTSGGLAGERIGLIAFDADSGDRLWTRQLWATGRPGAHPKSSNAAPTPASDGERVFTFYSSGDAAAYSLDGDLLWYRGLGSDYPNASNSLGMSSSLAVAEGVVVAMLENDTDSLTLGLEAETGKTAWKLDRPRAANWTSPTLVESGGRTLVALQSSKGVTAVDPKTGRTAWEWGDGASTIPSSAADGDTLFVPSDGLTAVRADGGEASVVWNNGKLSPGTPTPLVVGDRVVTVNRAGVLSAADVATGERAWQLRLSGPFSATPVAAGDLIFAVNEEGLLQVIRVSTDEAELVSERPLGETVLGTPALADGAIYVRSDDTLWKIGG